jgi:hypothetical protein
VRFVTRAGGQQATASTSTQSCAKARVSMERIVDDRPHGVRMPYNPRKTPGQQPAGSPVRSTRMGDLATTLLVMAAGLGYWGLLLGIGLRIHVLRKREQRAIGDILRNAGLETTPSQEGECVGCLEGFTVRVTKRGDHLLVEVDGGGRIPRDLRLSAEPPRSTSTDIQTGDTFFDQRIRITGVERTAIAVLRRDARSTVLREIAHRGVQVADGKLCLEPARLSDLGTALPALLELARQLELREEDVAARLADNARSDPCHELRLRSLRLLNEEFGQSKLAREVNVEALGSAQAPLRLEAAANLGREGLAALCTIARSESEKEDLRVKAVEHLGRIQWADLVADAIHDLLDTPAVRVRHAAIAALGELQYRSALPRLSDMARHADSTTAAVIAEALGAMGSPAAVPFLKEMLFFADTPVRIAAANALARIGTVDVVETLLAISHGKHPPELQRAAGWAVERIQSRVSGGERGQLSVVQLDPVAGGLSLAGAGSNGGELSLATRKRFTSEDTTDDEPGPPEEGAGST